MSAEFTPHSDSGHYTMAWDDTDAAPKKRPAFVLGADLSTLSVGELEEYLEVLATERHRVEAAREAKRKSQSAAESVFKK